VCDAKHKERAFPSPSPPPLSAETFGHAGANLLLFPLFLPVKKAVPAPFLPLGPLLTARSAIIFFLFFSFLFFRKMTATRVEKAAYDGYTFAIFFFFLFPSYSTQSSPLFLFSFRQRYGEGTARPLCFPPLFPFFFLCLILTACMYLVLPSPLAIWVE